MILDLAMESYLEYHNHGQPKKDKMDFIKILKFSASTDAIKKVKRCRKLM
jgi:hypothetical protein